MPHFISTQEFDFKSKFKILLGMKREEAPDVDATVAQIIADVRANGDAAIIALTKQFDGMTLTPETIAFSPDEIAREVAKVSNQDRTALELAAHRIKDYQDRKSVV